MDNNSMTIPEGLSCGDCRMYPKCAMLIGVKRDATEWTFFPVKFEPSHAMFAAYKQDVVTLRAEVARLQAENDRTYCAYCGEAFIRDDQAASRVSEHIRTCEKHPMRKVELELHNSEMTRKWLSDENQRVRMLLMPILESEDPAEYVEKLQAELQQAREANRWIPVGERLPELYPGCKHVSDQVLVSCIGDQGEPFMAVAYYDRGNKGWHVVASGFLLDCVITHWRPLPTPPEQEAE